MKDSFFQQIFSMLLQFLLEKRKNPPQILKVCGKPDCQRVKGYFKEFSA